MNALPVHQDRVTRPVTECDVSSKPATQTCRYEGMPGESATVSAETCCLSHTSIAVLSDHLISDFSALGAARVLGVVLDAQRACDDLSLPYTEVLGSVERAARRRLQETSPVSGGRVIAQRTSV
jgi:hypothetical protein